MKIISFNVWVASSTGKTPNNRDSIAVDMLMGEMPDVFGLQEFDPTYRNSPDGLISKIASYYSEAEVPDLDAEFNWNPIFYSHDKYNLIDSNLVSFSFGTEYNNNTSADGRSHFRTFTWAMFEDKITKNKFILLNTHYDTKIEAQPSQVAEISASVKSLYENHNCSIFVTGDYNSNITNGVAVADMKKNGFLDTHDLAPQNSRDDLRSYGGLPVLIDGIYHAGPDVTPYYATAVDHIFFYGNKEAVVIDRYKTIVSDYNIRASSDHVPVCIEVSIY